LIVAVMPGCGRKRQPTLPVEGKVVYQGKPLTFGEVLFQPDAGPVASGKIQSDGTFRLSTYRNGDGAVPGVYRVEITCYEGQRPAAVQGPGRGERGPGKSLIPAKYANFNISELQAEVKPQKSPLFFLFELK
jgi:hypothetical protein